MAHVRSKVGSLVTEIEKRFDEDRLFALDDELRPTAQIVDNLVSLGPEALEPLVASLSLTVPPVQSAILQAIGRIGTPDAQLALMRYLYDHQNDHATAGPRAMAMQGLASLVDLSQQNRFLMFLNDLKEESDPYVRGYMMEIYGTIGNTSTLSILEHESSCNDSFVKEKATAALHRLQRRLNSAEKHTLAKGLQDDTVPKEPTVPKSLESPETKKTAYSIRYASFEQRVAMLAGLAERPDRLDVLDSLQATDEKGEKIVLVALLNENLWHFNALEKLHLRQLVESILLHTSDNETEILAMRALGRLSDKTQVPPVSSAALEHVRNQCLSPNRSVSSAAVNAAGSLAYPQFRQVLEEAYRRSTPFIELHVEVLYAEAQVGQFLWDHTRTKKLGLAQLTASALWTAKVLNQWCTVQQRLTQESEGAIPPGLREQLTEQVFMALRKLTFAMGYDDLIQLAPEDAATLGRELESVLSYPDLPREISHDLARSFISLPLLESGEWSNARRAWVSRLLRTANSDIAENLLELLARAPVEEGVLLGSTMQALLASPSYLLVQREGGEAATAGPVVERVNRVACRLLDWLSKAPTEQRDLYLQGIQRVLQARLSGTLPPEEGEVTLFILSKLKNDLLT